MKRGRKFRKSLVCAVLSLVIPVSATAAEQGMDLMPSIPFPKKHEVQAGLFMEEYSFTSDMTRGASISVVYRDLDRLTLSAEIRRQEKFNREEGLFTVDVAYRVSERLVVEELVSFSPDNFTFPAYSSHTEAVYLPLHTLAFHFGYRLAGFKDVDVDIFSFGSTIYPEPWIYVHLRYLHSVTDFSDGPSDVSSDSFVAKMGAYPDRRNELALLYAKNSESFLSADRAGKFEADTYGVSWKRELSERWWLTASLYYQDRTRPEEGWQRTLEAGLIYRW